MEPERTRKTNCFDSSFVYSQNAQGTSKTKNYQLVTCKAMALGKWHLDGNSCNMHPHKEQMFACSRFLTQFRITFGCSVCFVNRAWGPWNCMLYRCSNWSSPLSASVGCHIYEKEKCCVLGLWIVYVLLFRETSGHISLICLGFHSWSGGPSFLRGDPRSQIFLNGL